MNPVFAPRRRCAMLGVMSNPRESAAAMRWREIVRGQADSGLSVAAYCRRARVPASSFYYWRRKLRDIAFNGDDAGTFAEVRVRPAPDPAADSGSANGQGALELHLPRGRRVIVRPGFDRRTLLELVAALEHDDVVDQEVRV